MAIRHDRMYERHKHSSMAVQARLNPKPKKSVIAKIKQFFTFNPGIKSIDHPVEHKAIGKKYKHHKSNNYKIKFTKTIKGEK